MDRKIFYVFLTIVVVLAVLGIRFFILKPQDPAELKVETNPSASVFLDDKLVGKTPLVEKYKPGEYVIKLIPEDSSSSVSSWTGKVALNPSLQTYVKRDMAGSEIQTSGEVLYLEKIQSGTELNVVTTPDSARVAVDGLERGTSPFFIKNISEGEHDITVSLPGFVPKTVRAMMIEGYKLNVSFQLAVSPDSVPVSSESGMVNPVVTAVPDSSSSGTGVVVIKDTPTGFLRVRTSPSTSAKEVAQVKPGETYKMLEKKEGWFKIEYEVEKEGWVSSRYAEEK